MKHEAKIVPGSVEKTSMHGIAFRMTCCDDPKTEASVHIQDAGFLDERELEMKIEQHLGDHAATHQKTGRALEHAERLAAKGHSACCGDES